MIIFLGNIGVLSPLRNGGYFDFYSTLPKFEAWFRRFENLNLVICLDYPDKNLTQLKSHFSKDIQNKIIGHYVPLRSNYCIEDINNWISINDYTGNWIGIQSEYLEMPTGNFENQEKIFLCKFFEGGFDDFQIKRIDKLLGKFVVGKALLQKSLLS